MGSDDLAARRDRAINRKGRLVLLVGDQFVALHDDLVHIPCDRVTHTGLAGQTVEIGDEVIEAAAGGKQANGLDGGGCLRRSPYIRAHQAAEHLQGILVFAEVGIDLAEKEPRLRAKLRIGRSFLQEIDRLGLLLLRALHGAGASGAEVAPRGVLTIRETLEAFKKSGFSFRSLVVQQVGKADVEIKRFERRVGGVDQRLEQFVDLGGDGGVVL